MSFTIVDGILTEYAPEDGETEITIPPGVVEIGNNAFENCTGLTTVVIPPGVTKIGSGAFYGCMRLTTVIIPEGVTKIGNHAFMSCKRLTAVVIPEGETKLGESAFAHCTALTTVIISEGVTKIGDYAFFNCWALTTVSLPASLTEIGEDAFYGCTSLESIIVESEEEAVRIKALLPDALRAKVITAEQLRSHQQAIKEIHSAVTVSALSRLAGDVHVTLDKPVVMPASVLFSFFDTKDIANLACTSKTNASFSIGNIMILISRIPTPSPALLLLGQAEYKEKMEVYKKLLEATVKEHFKTPGVIGENPEPVSASGSSADRVERGPG